MTWFAAGSAAVSVVGSMLGSSQAEKAAGEAGMQAARAAGKNKAGLEASMNRVQALLPQKTAAINDKAVLEGAAAQAATASAVAEATVSAAAAGATGGNVEQTVAQIEASGAGVKRGLEKQRASALLQVKQDYEDAFWEADNQKFDVNMQKSTGSPLAAAAIAGAGSFVKNGGLSNIGDAFGGSEAMDQAGIDAGFNDAQFF